MFDFEKLMGLLGLTREMVKELSEVEFMSFIGMLTDCYGADHGMSSDEIKEILPMIVEVQSGVHDQLGMSGTERGE